MKHVLLVVLLTGPIVAQSVTFEFTGQDPNLTNGWNYVVTQPQGTAAPLPANNGVQQNGALGNMTIDIGLTVDPTAVIGKSYVNEMDWFGVPGTHMTYQDVDHATYTFTFSPSAGSGYCEPQSGGSGHLGGQISATITGGGAPDGISFNSASALAAAGQQVSITAGGGTAKADDGNVAVKATSASPFGLTVTRGYFGVTVTANVSTGWQPASDTKQLGDSCAVPVADGASAVVTFRSDGEVDLTADSAIPSGGPVKAEAKHDVHSKAIMTLSSRIKCSGDVEEFDVVIESNSSH